MSRLSFAQVIFIGIEPVTWHLKEPVSPRATSTGKGFTSKEGGIRCSGVGGKGGNYICLLSLFLKKQTTIPCCDLTVFFKIVWLNVPSLNFFLKNDTPESWSLALEEAVPRAFWAVQVYWPECAVSVCKIWRVATLFKKVVWMLWSSRKSTPSLYQDTWRGSEPVIRQSKATGDPIISCTSFSFFVNEGGSLRSANRNGNVYYVILKHNKILGMSY